ncbi:transposase [Chryseobacterium nematophagum]|uniref:transposase n=1 Tax=Chryseobacterium nematophagum TaxID=2305228 RepID=UPI001E48838B|nr:transposase [Chryseobacterium nematophagum]
MINKKINFKYIHVGSLIQRKVLENGLSLSFLCKTFNCSEKEVSDMYTAETLDTEILLIWSKLLGYDFFRIYSEHLILYSPQTRVNTKDSEKVTIQKKKGEFRKNIYTRGMIEFILESLELGEKQYKEVLQVYGIPSSTLNKWMDKYKKIKD